MKAPSRGVESPVPTGVHTLVWSAADECCENPRKRKKKIIVAIGVDEPNSSEPVKGLKEEGVSGVKRYVLAGKRRMGQKRLREWANL